MMSYSIMYSVLPLLLVTLIPEGVVCVCSPPNNTQITDLDNLRQISTLKTIYETDEVVAFACNQGYGHGYLRMKCLGESAWGDRSRQCSGKYVWCDRSGLFSDMQPYEGGAIAGTMCGAFTLVVCVVFIAFSTQLKKEREKEEEVEMKIMNTAEATKA